MRLLAIAVSAVFLTAASCRNPRIIQAPGPILEADAGSAAGAADPVSAPDHIIQAMVDDFQRVHFGYDSASLDGESKAALSRNAALMQSWNGLHVEVQGHADARGSTEYNIALGYRRAAAVQGYLVASGVSPERVALMSYGEEVPLVSARSETAWARNRRAEFRVLSGEGAHGTVD